MDKETEKEILRQESISHMVSSSGWKEAKRIMEEIIAENSSVLSMDTKVLDPQRLAVELAARQMAVVMLRTWVEELEGTKSQLDAYRELEAEEDKGFIEHK